MVNFATEGACTVICPWAVLERVYVHVVLVRAPVILSVYSHCVHCFGRHCLRTRKAEARYIDDDDNGDGNGGGGC